MVYEKGTFPAKNGIQKGLPPPLPYKLWTVRPGSHPTFSEATQKDKHEPFDFPNGINTAQLAQVQHKITTIKFTIYFKSLLTFSGAVIFSISI